MGFANDFDIPSQRQKGAQILSYPFHIVHDQYTDVRHGLNIRAEALMRIWRQVESRLERKADFSDPS
jgi:hypothetical protein